MNPREPECRATWRFDRSINLGSLVSLITSLALVAGLLAGQSARLGAAEEKLLRVEHQVEQLRDTAVKVERIDERVLGIRSILLEIKGELKTLREG
ncbi:MAG: hypothetical protein AB7D51_12745 [Desulfovibrionaceae bacterium]